MTVKRGVGAHCISLTYRLTVAPRLGPANKGHVHFHAQTASVGVAGQHAIGRVQDCLPDPSRVQGVTSSTRAFPRSAAEPSLRPPTPPLAATSRRKSIALSCRCEVARNCGQPQWLVDDGAFVAPSALCPSGAEPTRPAHHLGEFPTWSLAGVVDCGPCVRRDREMSGKRR
jgi:hypothetical protein